MKRRPRPIPIALALVALVLLWLVRPLWHGLAMFFWTAPLVWLPPVILLIAGAVLLRRSRRSWRTAGELLRLRGDAADGLRFDIAVRRLRLPPYRGDASGILPVYADRHVRALRAAAPQLQVRQEGKANVSEAPGYEVWFRPRPGDRTVLGRDTMLVPRSGARDGLLVTYRQAKRAPLTEADQDVIRDVRETVATVRFRG